MANHFLREEQPSPGNEVLTNRQIAQRARRARERNSQNVQPQKSAPRSRIEKILSAQAAAQGTALLLSPDETLQREPRASQLGAGTSTETSDPGYDGILCVASPFLTPNSEDSAMANHFLREEQPSPGNEVSLNRQIAQRARRAREINSQNVQPQKSAPRSRIEKILSAQAAQGTALLLSPDETLQHELRASQMGAGTSTETSANQGHRDSNLQSSSIQVITGHLTSSSREQMPAMSRRQIVQRARRLARGREQYLQRPIIIPEHTESLSQAKDSFGKHVLENISDIHKPKHVAKKKRTTEVSKNEALDDIPMDIVELLAKNQHQRRIMDAKKATFMMNNLTEMTKSMDQSGLNAAKGLEKLLSDAVPEDLFKRKTLSSKNYRSVEHNPNSVKQNISMDLNRQDITMASAGLPVLPECRSQHMSSARSPNCKSRNNYYPQNYRWSRGGMLIPESCHMVQTISHQNKDTNSHGLSSVLLDGIPFRIKPQNANTDSSYQSKLCPHKLRNSSHSKYRDTHGKLKVECSNMATHTKVLNARTPISRNENPKQLFYDLSSIRRDNMIQVNNNRGEAAHQSLTTEICALNQNPADFPILDEDNEYMIKSKDLMASHRTHSGNLKVPNHNGGQKQQKVMKLTALTGLVRSGLPIRIVDFL